MPRKFRLVLSCFLFAALLYFAEARAQESSTGTFPPDSAQVTTHVDAAKKIAGAQWAFAANFFCSNEEQVAAMHILPSSTQNDPEETHRAEPMKIFDNMYFVGTKEVTTWAITTPEGIVLIDSGYVGKEESTLVAGMKKLGLDPTQIKAVLIAHGHSDHYGGALYLQEHYGAHVYMSAQDWDFIYPAPPGQTPHAAQPGPLPKRDMILAEGQPFSLGGETITPVLIPGHTPGAMGFIFPVKDEGHTHIAALFGGTILSPARRFKPDQWEQYLKSLNHFKEITQKMNADVELVNHPIMDGAFDKMARLKERKPGQPDPFVVGTTGFQKFIGVMTECARAQLDRVGGSV